MVKGEFDLLGDDARVYKLIGPALVRQDCAEAKANVNKRLDFINGELERIDEAYKAKSEELAKYEQEGAKITKTFQDFQAAMARQGQASQ